MAPPHIVAESLQAVPDPLVTMLRPGPPASGHAVAASLAQALAPEEAADSAPAWLLPAQVQSFRRVLATLRRYSGAMLTDPVGSGKTYVALAVAAALSRGPTVCLVPATLLGQWESIAASLDVPVTLCSHEQASRGHLPPGTRGLVIIDESHHFRHPATRRYRHVASWLIGRAALLITATPVVNRAADLSNQLLLAVPDDALLFDGIVSLRALLTKGNTTPALGQLVIEGESASEGKPSIVRTTTGPTGHECTAMDQAVELLGRLHLSRSESTAALLRKVLLRAAGSSPAALLSTLARYRRLLLHARDARRSGQVLDRSAIRRFTGELADQLIWWELLEPAEMASDIDLQDLTEIDDVIHSARDAAAGSDDKLLHLRAILDDGVPSLVFTSFRETVRYIRDGMADSRLAWCTGEKAGMGHTRLPRFTVLGWFGANASTSLGPRHLVVTDVAAEGLNLQRAARVIHYDLPWTPMRLDQREGRSARSGSRYPEVQVVRFTPPPILERWLGVERLLERKSRLPAVLGLGPQGKQIWRWRSELASRFVPSQPVRGAALVAGEQEGLLAGFTLQSGHPPAWLSSTIVWLQHDGSCTESPDLLAARLEQAAAQFDITPADNVRLRSWLIPLALAIKARMTLAGSRRWILPEPSPGARRVAARLQAFTREAARMHRPDRLMQLERALAFVTRGHTAGEAALIEKLAESSDSELYTALSKLPHRPSRCDSIDVRLTGLILFAQCNPVNVPERGTGYTPC